jgi:predicted amidophosphoribosyltransferase
LFMPLWFFAGMAATPPAVWLVRTLIRARAKPGECPACGYDLRSSEGPTCPECGAPHAGNHHSASASTRT